MGSLCDMYQNPLNQMIRTSILLSRRWSLICLIYDLRFGMKEAHPQPLFPAQLYQLPGSRHSAFGECFSTDHYQNQFQNICLPWDTAGHRGSERYGTPPVRSEASRLQGTWTKLIE